VSPRGCDNCNPESWFCGYFVCCVQPRSVRWSCWIFRKCLPKRRGGLRRVGSCSWPSAHVVLAQGSYPRFFGRLSPPPTNGNDVARLSVTASIVSVGRITRVFACHRVDASVKQANSAITRMQGTEPGAAAPPPPGGGTEVPELIVRSPGMPEGVSYYRYHRTR